MPPIRLFWVDDCVEFVAFAKEMLKEFPQLELIGSTASAEAALEAIRRLKPDLVLIDLALQGMTGLEAVCLLKNWPQPPRVVLVTGSDMPEYRQAAKVAGADGFLPKPDLMQALAPLVEELFAK
jgi:DNA-binding NarL/FixJ family response regulator